MQQVLVIMFGVLYQEIDRKFGYTVFEQAARLICRLKNRRYDAILCMYI